MLGEDSEVEFRPSFFLSPSRLWKSGRGLGKWIEMMGSGMLHPNVLKNCGLDPKKVQGFAFGGGLDRIAMIKWGFLMSGFYQGDLRLNQI